MRTTNTTTESGFDCENRSIFVGAIVVSSGLKKKTHVLTDIHSAVRIHPESKINSTEQ